IKVLYKGGYGFAATNQLDRDNIKNLAARAFRVAKASGRTMKQPVELADEPTHNDTVMTPMKEDPSKVDQEEIIALLVDITKAADIGDNRVKVRSAKYEHWKDHMVLWTSESTKIDQIISIVGGGGNVLAVGSGDTQQRGFPNSVRGDFATSGYEYFRNMGTLEQIAESAREAVALLDAPKCPSLDNANVIIHPGQLFLHLHENGHGFEMDRAYDYEAAFAGTSFLKPHLLNDLKFGNEMVTIHADATKPRGLGTFYYDHEGVSAQKTTLVDKGTFVGYMSSRETAGFKGWERSTGSARARTYDRMPLIRMTNINLEPGDWDYDELIEDTKDGYMMDTNLSWSIDDLRLSFQFGCEIGWRIEKGEITGLIKNPSYTGITPKFWNSVTAVTNEKAFKMFGTPNCGKGEPDQIMYTGHGASPTRFENVRIGVY
ncbi:MAG: TldD/PmbA family protein, partial [Candidatus Heimdallarchaeota archaeon]|nr:TldD/PmbA family protein [Candidatus Heimdallarchaeota archaeon]